MSEDTVSRKSITGALAVVVICIVAFLIYRQSQPNLGNVPQINMSREEIERGAMGAGTAALSAADPDEPPTATPKKGSR
jgi:hypothetical protein